MLTSVQAIFTEILDLRCAAGLDTEAQKLTWIKNSALTKNIYFFRDEFDRPMGYVIWANVNRYSISKLKKTKKFPLYSYEWDEGYITLLLEVMFLRTGMASNQKYLLSFLRKQKIISHINEKGLKLKVRHKQKWIDMSEII